MRSILIAAVTTALVVPGTAAAGGWATAGLTPPEDPQAGKKWAAEITVLQHGQTPLQGVEPALTISNGKTKKSFPARATDEPGVYVAEVVFPSNGTWSYSVDDGFGGVHTFAAVTVGGGSGDSGARVLPIAGGVVAALAAGFALFLLSRRLRVRAPAPSH